MHRLLLTLIALTCLTIHAQTPWKTNRFPIACWGGPPRSHNTLEHYQTLRDANFNITGPTGDHTVESNRKLLDFCQKVGLKAIICDGRIGTQMVLRDDWTTLISQIIADHGSHPALYGYHLIDEPSSELFDALGKISRELERRDPGHLPYINLLPTYAQAGKQLGTPTYREHLELFLRTTQPRLLSYDHYALLKKGGIRDDYYENMELMRNESLRSGIPWWYVHASGAYDGYRAPNAAEMRWQVYTSLAYGTKGISYWHYWARKHKDPSRSGVVDFDGKPTFLYNILKPLNRETQVIGNVLLPAVSRTVYHTGEIPAGARRQGSEDIVQLPAEAPLLTGIFTAGENRQYALIVNRDYQKPVEFTASFARHITIVEQLSPKDASPSPLPLDQKRSAALQLAPGNGVLLRLTTEFSYPKPPKMLHAIAFHFNNKDGLEGWDLSNLYRPKIAGGTVTMALGSHDPFLKRSYLDIPANTYKALRVRMRVDSGNPYGQIFWITDDEPIFASSKHINFPIVPDGSWQEYEIPMDNHERWKGKKIRGIRLDPNTGGAEPKSEVEIDWIVGVPKNGK